MTLTVPPPGQKVIRPDGGMDQTWYEKIKSAFGFVDQLNAAFGEQSGQLGTAAFKDIGTSGDSVPLLNTQNTFSKAQTFDPVVLEDAASIAWDWSRGPIARVTLTDNRALAAPTNVPTGKTGTWSLFVYQDGTGSRTLTLDPVYLPPEGESVELAAEPGKFDVLTFVSDGTSIAVAISLNHKATA